ncbi:MAG: phosphodiester glycosidase family protein, partial [Chloroflexota bacterium]|nr:phosphodiester glycosidase family protein [Chloroflexota bacterium]
QLRPGVVLSNVDLLTGIGPLHIHQITVDLATPGLHLSTVLAHNSVVSTGETVSSMANRTGALAGINGDYFAIHASGVPFNMTIQNGNLIRSGNSWAVFAVGTNNHPDIGKFDWQGSVSALNDARLRFPIAAVNLPLMDHSIIAVNQSMGSVLGADNATLTYLRPEATPGVYRVRAVAEHQAIVPPVSGANVVLAGEGVAATWLAEYAPVGARLRLDYQTQPGWQGIKTALGGGPILLQSGLPYRDSEAPAPFEADALYPVSGVGVSRDGRTLWLVAVDGHEGAPAYGLTRSQFAWYFQTIGAWEAMAFDSGGSATLVARLPGKSAAGVINAPADGTERPVADGLFIYG